MATMLPPTRADDWPQLQHDARRSGRTIDATSPPYRIRWMRTGPDALLRNRDSVANWTDDLHCRPGYSLPLPRSPPMTLAESVQPVVADGRVFFATLEGGAFALDAGNGDLLWSATLPVPVVATAASGGGRTFFVTAGGDVVALDANSGRRNWSLSTGRSITAAPCLAGTNALLVADHGGTVRCLDPESGRETWARQLSAPIQGGLACDDRLVFAGCEDLRVYALQLADGSVVATNRLRGQSFRFNHPVVSGGLVWWQSAMTPCIGSEYAMDAVMADSSSLENEERNIAQWLSGDDHGGRWPEASVDWRHLFALRVSDLTEPFRIACGPVGGCGIPPEPVCVDHKGRVLAWWPTRFPRLTRDSSFGTKFATDIAAVDPAAGRRVPIDNGRLSGMWPGPEADNCYALSVAGHTLWLRQRFRGTQTIDLETSAHHFVQAEVRARDGGVFNADVVYSETGADLTRPAQPPTAGRAAPAIVGGRIFIAESYGIVCLEHAGGKEPSAPEPTAAKKDPGPVEPVSRPPVAAQPPAALTAAGIDRIAWQHPVVSGIRGADDLVGRLRGEVQRVLDAGPLAPLRLAYGDIRQDFLVLYNEPGRIVTTLAWAYPHLTAEQQEAVRGYVARELANPSRCPWSARVLPLDRGARREIHPADRVWDAGSSRIQRRPAVGAFYGLWLYAQRGGDADAVRAHWPAMRDGYRAQTAEACLYGTMGAHLGMLRLAERFGDAEIAAWARQRLDEHLQAGLSFATIEERARRMYPAFYERRRAGGVCEGWMFLDLTPEIGRYLREYVAEPVLARHDAALRLYPLWWLANAPYFCRWTGDESVGLPPEIFGMIVPVERWVLNRDGAEMRGWFRSHPTGLGDCHWIEALVQAIEAHGRTEWRDVRTRFTLSDTAR